MLYSKNGNYPEVLPFRIRLSDGRTRTDPSTFTESEISEAEYVSVPDEPIPSSTQVVEWDSENIHWVVRDKTPQEIENELNSAKKSRMNYITSSRDSELRKLSCMWNNDQWDARETDSTRIANVLTMIEQAANLGIPTPSTVDWRTYDDQNRTLSIPELTQLGASMFQAQQIVWVKQATLKDQVQAATTVEEVNSINW
jgi:hypothetical protein